MFKRFIAWIGLKEKLHTNSDNRVYFNEKEVWWCALGENIGVEVNGKGDMFSRPILMYKKLGSASFLAIPLSTKEKVGSWYLQIKFKERITTLNFAQIKVISIARLYEKMGEVTKEDFEKVKDGFLRLYS